MCLSTCFVSYVCSLFDCLFFSPQAEANAMHFLIGPCGVRALCFAASCLEMFSRSRGVLLAYVQRVILLLLCLNTNKCLLAFNP